MATLNELGVKYPCQAQGVYIPPDDETTPIEPGQVMEAHFESDTDINTYQAAIAIRDVLLTKNDYPEFVLHYVRIETRKVIVQFSHSPPEGGISTISGSNGSITQYGGRVSAIHLPVWAIVLIIMGAITFFTALNLRMFRGYLWSPPLPLGHAVVHAKDHETGLGIRDVRITVDGQYEGTTTSSGSIKVENLLEGDHIFEGEIIEGYHDPDPVTATIVKGKQITVDLVYYPDDKPKPTTGSLLVNTHPVKGEVFIDAISYGEAPVGPVELERGKHYVTFGAVEGYITPGQQTAYIQGDETSSIVGEYLTPGDGEAWYEKYLKYALIGGGAILGATLLVPELIRALRRREQRK